MSPGCPKSEAQDLVSGTLQIWKTGMLWRFDGLYARNVRMAVCINIYYIYNIYINIYVYHICIIIVHQYSITSIMIVFHSFEYVC